MRNPFERKWNNPIPTAPSSLWTWLDTYTQRCGAILSLHHQRNAEGDLTAEGFQEAADLWRATIAGDESIEVEMIRLTQTRTDLRLTSRLSPTINLSALTAVYHGRHPLTWRTLINAIGDRLPEVKGPEREAAPSGPGGTEGAAPLLRQEKGYEIARNKRVFRIFLASPSDVEAERDAAARVVDGLNTENQDVVLELIQWKTHSYPDFGKDPQAVLNEQIGEEYDIFVGILWTRFGTPTPRAQSGTEEEFNRAYARHQADPDSVRLMLYFKEEAIEPNKIDPDQFEQVRGFQRQVPALGGLYGSFGSTAEFERVLRRDLIRQIRRWGEQQAVSTGVHAETGSQSSRGE